MLSYNYTSGYDFLSYMEYPVLLLQEYALIFYAFKYQDLLGKKTQVIAVLYSIVVTLVYLRLFPIIILTFLVVSNLNCNIESFQWLEDNKDIAGIPTRFARFNLLIMFLRLAGTNGFAMLQFVRS